MYSMSGLTGESEVSLPCAISSVTSPPIAAGAYIVTPELYSAGEPLATAPNRSNVLVWSGTNTMMSPVEFIVNATGSLEISIQAIPANGNCQSIAQGGAGISSMTIAMTHDQGCAPVTLTRMRGNAVIGQYAVNCATPMVATCIESDEILITPVLPSGSYIIHVAGRILAKDCWHGDGPIQIPAGGKRKSAMLNLNNESIPGCPHP